MKKHQDIDDRELQRRVLHALSRPVARIADAFGAPLTEAAEAVRMSYFHHLKRRGLTLARIAERLGVSERQSKRLQQLLRTSLLDGESRYDLPVRVELMLWATPMSRAKLKQVLSAWTGDEVDEAVNRLHAEGRIVEDEGRTPVLRVNHAVNELARDTWVARIGGLTSFLGNLTDAVFGRFFRDEPRAFARTLSFLVRPEDVPELERIFREQLVPAIARIDEAASAADEGEAFRLSICWAPFEYLDNALKGEGDEE